MVDTEKHLYLVTAGFIGLLQSLPSFVRRIFLMVRIFFQGRSRGNRKGQDQRRAVFKGKLIEPDRCLNMYQPHGTSIVQRAIHS